MGSLTMLYPLVLALFLTFVSANPRDETRTPGAVGSAIVESVVDQVQASCIFSDDKLFGRRLAYVESGDGKHPDTYRDGYHGGIWQVGRRR